MYILSGTAFKLIGDNPQLGKFLGLCVILSGSPRVAKTQTMDLKMQIQGPSSRGLESCSEIVPGQNHASLDLVHNARKI